MAAMIIPNGIQVNTQRAKHTFSSFIFREVAYQQLNSLWTIHQPKRPQQQPSQQSQSSLTSLDKQIMDPDGPGSDYMESIAINTDDDDDDEDHMATFGQRYNHQHHCSPSFYHSSIWKIMAMVVLLLNSLWMMRKWTQLDNRLQHQYHNHLRQHRHHLLHLQSLFDPFGLSTSYFEKSSSQHPYYRHPISTKLTQFHQPMESLNQQIIDQQLHIYDYSLNNKIG